jgi:hypothetical protein
MTHAYATSGNFTADVDVVDEDNTEMVGGWVNITIYPAGTPKITINSPTEGQVINTRRFQVNFSVESFTMYPGGNHIQFQLDNGPEEMWYSTDAYTLAGLA